MNIDQTQYCNIMVNIQFQLKDTQAIVPTSVRCVFYYHGKRFMYSLGDDKSILPKLWDFKNNVPVAGKSKEEKDHLKTMMASNPNIETEIYNIGIRIDNIKRGIFAFISNKELSNQPLVFDELKNHLDLLFDKKVKKTDVRVPISVSLNEYIENFIEGVISGKITYTTGNGERKVYAGSTAKVYKEFKTQFDLYQRVKKIKLSFEHITMDFYKDYVQFFSDKNYSNNSIGKQVKCLKAVLSKAFDDGVHSNNIFKKSGFKALKSDVDNIYLTENELKLIYDLDLSSIPHLDSARDIFLCGCYTALRYSDYKRLRKEHFGYKEGTFCIDLITQKTKNRVIIPVKPLIKSIIEKYDFNLPKSNRNKLNKYIKEVGLLAGIDEKIEVKSIRGSRTSIEYFPKYQLIMSHTARRTGATLLYKAGVNTLSIMKITGHKTEKSLLKYIKISEEENAIKLTDNSFFK